MGCPSLGLKGEAGEGGTKTAVPGPESPGQSGPGPQGAPVSGPSSLWVGRPAGGPAVLQCGILGSGQGRAGRLGRPILNGGLGAPQLWCVPSRRGSHRYLQACGGGVERQTSRAFFTEPGSGPGQGGWSRGGGERMACGAGVGGLLPQEAEEGPGVDMRVQSLGVQLIGRSWARRTWSRPCPAPQLSRPGGGQRPQGQEEDAVSWTP